MILTKIFYGFVHRLPPLYAFPYEEKSLRGKMPIAVHNRAKRVCTAVKSAQPHSLKYINNIRQPITARKISIQ
jgi:hypothetical protein